MEQALRVVVVGCGRVVEEGHVAGLVDSPRFDVTAVVDPVAARRARVGDLLGVPDPARLATHRSVDGDLADVAWVTTPPHARRAVIEDLAGAGLDIVAEKPLAASLGDVDGIRATLSRCGATLAMLHNYPLFPEFRMIGERVATGDIGPIHTIIFRALGSAGWDGVADYRPRWRDEIAISGGGRMLDMGIHGLCLASRWLDEPCRSVTAEVERPRGRVEERCFALYRFGGSVVSCEIAAGLGSGGVEVVGTDARIELVYPADLGSFAASPVEVIVRDGAGPTRTPLTPRSQFPTELYERTWRALTTHRSDADVVEARHLLELVHAAYLAATEGRTVTLPLDAALPIHDGGITAIWS